MSPKKFDFKRIGETVGKNQNLPKQDVYDLVSELISRSIEKDPTLNEKEKRVAIAAINVLKEMIKD